MSVANNLAIKCRARNDFAPLKATQTRILLYYYPYERSATKRSPFCILRSAFCIIKKRVSLDARQKITFVKNALVWMLPDGNEKTPR